jgi:ribonucleoside-diphosphate reductase beta chain
MLFEEQISRKPDLYPWTKDLIDAMWQGHWTPNEFDFQSDVQDFKCRLTQEEKDVVVKSLSAIAQIENSVKSFWAMLGNNLPHPSIKDMGYVMANIEVIHNIAYEKLLITLGIDGVFEENLKLDIIEGRDKYLRKHVHKYYKDSKKQYIYAIILFTLYVENVSLFSQFYIINWLHHYKNVLKDTGQQIQYTAKEETLHAMAGIRIINTLRQEYPELFDEELEARISEETQEAYKAEAKIVDWILGDYNEPKLNSTIVKEFIKDRLNTSIMQIGFKSMFEVDEELVKQTAWFDEDVMGNTSTDFFYKKPVEYSKNSQVITSNSLFD